jgi:hypothetical protein
MAAPIIAAIAISRIGLNASNINRRPIGPSSAADEVNKQDRVARDDAGERDALVDPPQSGFSGHLSV